MNDLKITISVGGRFHAFNLAQQLYKKGCLERLITSYPKFEVKKYGLPEDKIKSIVIKEILARSWQKMPFIFRRFINPEFFISDLFDRLASSEIKNSDIFVGWDSFSLYSLRRAKKLGSVTALDHGSAHPNHTHKILSEERERLGLRPGSYTWLMKRELAEYNQADYIFLPSTFAKNTFLDNGISEDKITQIPYGVDLCEFKKIKKEDDIFRIIFVGSMTLAKGVHYLIQAFSELNLRNAELLLIGPLDREMKPVFMKYAGKFKWIGYVPQKELYKYYSQSSVFVLNSIDDGFGMVILQAMACGLPVICTTNTGGPDVIREGKDGFIIPIRDVDALKERLRYLYENREICQRMGQSAEERVSSGFTWDHYGDKMIVEYKRILKLSGKN